MNPTIQPNTAPPPPASSPQNPLNFPKKPFKRILLIPIVILAFFLIVPAVFLYFKPLTLTPKQINKPKNFQLVKSSPEDQDNDFSAVGQPTFVFSKNIGVSESELSKYFQITPTVSGSWHKEKNGKVIYFATDKTSENNLPNTLEYNTVYTITISKDFHSSDNQKLTDDITVAFRTSQNLLFNLSSDDKLKVIQPTSAEKAVNLVLGKPFGNQVLNLTDSDLDKQFNLGGSRTNPYLTVGSFLTITIQPASEEQLLQYFSYRNDNYPLYQFIPDSNNPPPIEFQRPLQSGKSEYNFEINIGHDVFSKPGIYFVTLKHNYGREDLFVAVSNHINQVFEDDKNTYVWTTRSDNAKSLGGTTTRFYSVNNIPNLLDKVITGSDGIARSNQPSDLVDFVLTQIDDDIAITYSKAFFYKGFLRKSEDHNQIFSYSDRPIYRPGDTVYYKAVVRKRENGKYVIPKGTYYVRLSADYTKAEQDEDYKTISLDANGTITFDTKIPQAVTGTYPQITLSTKNKDGTYNQVNSLPIVIQAYKKPDLDIEAIALEKEYISSDSAHFTVYAKTDFGQPLANINFTYRVLLNDYNEVKDRNSENLGNYGGYYGGGEELTAGNSKFDNKGIARLSFDTTLPSKFESSQLATLEITPNIGASPSIGKIVKLIHRGEFAVFIDDTKGNTDEGISGKISLLDHKNPRQAIGDKQVTVSLYDSTNNQNKKLIKSQEVTSGSDGTITFNFDGVGMGSYDIVTQSKDNRGNLVTARKYVYVGQKPVTTDNKPTYTLTLKTTQDKYKVNETANITASTNFEPADAIVIITNLANNSSRILSLSKATLPSSSSNIPLFIKDDYGEQVGVDVFTVNSGTVAYGHADIAIDLGKKTVNTKITFDKSTYKPKDTVVATITTKDEQGNPVSADNSLSVIDAALLQISTSNGNIYDSFYGYSPTSYVVAYNSTTGISKFLGGGAGGCFLEGTKILLANGSTKNIENIEVGDRILTRTSEGSAQMVPDIVIKTYRHAVTDYLTINNKLNVTPSHRIYLNNSWQQASEAKIGDALLDENGDSVKITSITPRVGQFYVYNLTTAKYHTFFAEGFYVHNDKGEGEARQKFVDTVYWNPHIQTDINGKATVSFKLPDNLTTFTTQVFSNTKSSQFGQAEAEFVSQKDFNIISSLANFYYQGDKPVITTLIQNSSSEDKDIEISLSIKETNFVKTNQAHIAKGDLAISTFSFDVGTGNNISVLIEARDKLSGDILDSLAIKKPILPLGNIVSSWTSSQGSQNYNFTATYPFLDFNSVTLTVVPNVISGLFHSDFYLRWEPSVETGEQIYSYAYILAKTRDGFISPTSFDYSKLKNEFRVQIAKILRERKDDYWLLSSYGRGESFAAVNLWLAQGLHQASTLHLLDEVNNLKTLIDNTKKYINKDNGGSFNPDFNDEWLARQWVLNQRIGDSRYKDTPQSLAAQTLNNNTTALAQLRSLALLSADDRYIWDGNDKASQIFPVLAMIEKGSDEEADKAIKGLSFTQDNPGTLALLAGAKYAVRKNKYVEEPSIQIVVNNQNVYKTAPTQQYSPFSQTYSPKNTQDGKVAINIQIGGDIPVYNNVVQADFNATTPKPPSKSIFGNFGSLFRQSQAQAKVIDLNLTRAYKNLRTGTKIPEINQGETGVAVLTANTAWTKFVTEENQDFYNPTYSFQLQDAITPSFIYLDQTSGNSPQNQSSLNKIFPNYSNSKGQTFRSYSSPTAYSDQTVLFDDRLNPTFNQIILPYVVYNTAVGTYYQPKTSLVFPILGLITTER